MITNYASLCVIMHYLPEMEQNGTEDLKRSGTEDGNFKTEDGAERKI